MYGDHQTADQITTRIPMILRWPGQLQPGRRSALHYHIDVFATLLDMLHQKIPSRWDGVSFADTLLAGADVGREELIVSQAAWACQRGVRFDRWMYIHTRHDAYHLYPEEMLFDLSSDPHQQFNQIDREGEVAALARRKLSEWLAAQLPTAARGRDPHDNVMAEGGPFHVRNQLPDYIERLRATERGVLADRLLEVHGPL